MVTHSARPNDFATVGLALAAAAIVCRFFSQAELGIGIGLAAVVMALMGIRHGVRNDRGMPQALFALAFGVLAVMLGVFLRGAQHGGQFSGSGPSPAHQATAVARA